MINISQFQITTNKYLMLSFFVISFALVTASSSLAHPCRTTCENCGRCLTLCFLENLAPCLCSWLNSPCLLLWGDIVMLLKFRYWLQRGIQGSWSRTSILRSHVNWPEYLSADIVCPLPWTDFVPRQMILLKSMYIWVQFRANFWKSFLLLESSLLH